MNKKDSLGDRMKRYEAVPKIFLMRKQPVIVRLDMKAGHTFTRGFEKPFDRYFMDAMQETMLYLCKNIQGCVLGYTQSDEITLVLCDYQKIDTDAWYEYNVQKIVSVSASMATMKFNQYFYKAVSELYVSSDEVDIMINDKTIDDYYDILQRAADRGAMFDSRTFNLPLSEVNNCLIWRQQDATRNSIQALAQSLFSHKQLQGLNCSQLQDKMFVEKGVNWNDLSTTKKRGSCCVQIERDSKRTWVIDNDIPIFTQDRDYVNSRIIFND